jgi:FkbM family methyltransferase
VEILIDYLNKLRKKIKFDFSFEEKEIRRINKIPRYHSGTTKILGSDFEFVDSISFIGQYKEIIKKQIYNFKSDHEQPYILDCGSNVGVSILYFKKLYPNASIVGFEPDEMIFKVLEKNLSKNDLGNITLLNKGVWNSEGIKYFYYDGADGGHIVNADDQLIKTRNLSKVNVTRLLEYLDRKVDFLKIDIEGAEAIVIEDCKSLLRNVSRIFIEYHPVFCENQAILSILRNLNENGFNYIIKSATLQNNSPFIEKQSYSYYDNLLYIFAYKNDL